VTEEAALLVGAETLPERVAVGPEAIDGRAPTDFGAALPEPAPAIRNRRTR